MMTSAFRPARGDAQGRGAQALNSQAGGGQAAPHRSACGLNATGGQAAVMHGARGQPITERRVHNVRCASPPGLRRAAHGARHREHGLTFKAFIVEDNASIRESLIEALSELAGVDTTGTAADEQAAVAWLGDPANEWNLAIIDLVLEPGGSGFGVLDACRHRRPDQKVVVLTATANPAVRAQCRALGSDGVFDKSMETDDLIEYCAHLVRESQR
jgi:CheY-like chemotaxis protein